MVPIFNKVFSVNEKVVICVELPKFAVNNVEMFIGEVPEISPKN